MYAQTHKHTHTPLLFYHCLIIKRRKPFHVMGLFTPLETSPPLSYVHVYHYRVKLTLLTRIYNNKGNKMRIQKLFSPNLNIAVIWDSTYGAINLDDLSVKKVDICVVLMHILLELDSHPITISYKYIP